jgi:hypothetical protein
MPKEMFEWEFTFQSQNIDIPKNITTEEWEELIWYDFPIAFISKNGNFLFFIQEAEEGEYWFLIYVNNINVTINYLQNKLTYQELLLSNDTNVFLVLWDVDKEFLEIIRELNKHELEQEYRNLGKDSYIGNLYPYLDELISLLSKKDTIDIIYENCYNFNYTKMAQNQQSFLYDNTNIDAVTLITSMSEVITYHIPIIQLYLDDNDDKLNDDNGLDDDTNLQMFKRGLAA